MLGRIQSSALNFGQPAGLTNTETSEQTLRSNGFVLNRLDFAAGRAIFLFTLEYDVQAVR